MNAALNHLYAGLTTLATNEPINRAEGNLEQADKQLRDIADIEHTLKFLRLNTDLTLHHVVWERGDPSISVTTKIQIPEPPVPILSETISLPSHEAAWKQGPVTL
jgi:hypothetical protein